MKFSFILPIYKVEDYLQECVNSLINQTYKNIEIILVDDGSPDGCPAICDQLATEDNRIKALHKPNGGLSDARNAGLTVASGDYIVFVDSDDIWVGNDSLYKLVSHIEQYPDCQFYGFNCQYYYPSTHSYRKWVQYSKDLTSPVNGSYAMTALVMSGTFPMSACLKVINRQWLVDNNIKFKVSQISEDIPWFINLLDKCKKCMFVNDYIYAYRQNVEGSITASRSAQHFYNLVDIINTELALIDKRTFTFDAKNALRSFLAYEVSILISLIKDLPKEKRSAARNELKELCWLLKYNLNPKVHIVNRVYKIFNFRVTELILRLYDWYKSSRR